jgi:MFS transporter, SP family, sugar:H+ symporter
MAWAVAAEIYPGRYRSEAIALCSAANWLFNFLLAFFTTFITSDIGFAYGYVFAGCNLAAVFIVYFFLPETNNKTLEEIDTMFLLEVSPLKSSRWEPPQAEDLITADKLMLNKGASRIDKRRWLSSQKRNTQRACRASQAPKNYLARLMGWTRVS